ncbi:hypothetical protein ACE6H2_020302 [Prunus campanulata]
MYNSADRISELPLEILASILSLLPLKEAVATSVLSRHWWHVWASTLTLDFDPRKLCLASHTLVERYKTRKVCGHRNIVEHVLFFIENSFALEKLVIDPTNWECHHSGSEWGKRKRLTEAKARHHAMHLKNKVPATVEFVCL